MYLPNFDGGTNDSFALWHLFLDNPDEPVTASSKKVSIAYCQQYLSDYCYCLKVTIADVAWYVWWNRGIQHLTEQLRLGCLDVNVRLPAGQQQMTDDNEEHDDDDFLVHLLQKSNVVFSYIMLSNDKVR